MFENRYGHEAAVLDGCIYVLGGRVEPGGGYLASVDVLDKRTLQWRATPNMSAPRACVHGRARDPDSQAHHRVTCEAVIWLISGSGSGAARTATGTCGSLRLLASYNIMLSRGWMLGSRGLVWRCLILRRTTETAVGSC